jgi:hypothetical protein
MDPLIVFGAVLILIGGGMVIWPSEVLSISKDDDGKPLPQTPSNVRWMRAFGVAIVFLGLTLVFVVLAGVKGADDPVLF